MTGNYNDEQFIKLIEEAHVNFDTGRYENARKGYNFLIQMCVKKQRYEEMIYFTYRSILAANMNSDIVNRIKTLHQLGIQVISRATAEAIKELENSFNAEEKNELLWITQKNLKMLGEKERRIPILQSIVNQYSMIINNENESYDDRKYYYERLLETYKELSDFDQYYKLKQELAEMMEKEARSILNSNGFDVQKVAACKLIDTAKVYLEVKKEGKYKKLIEEAKKLYPEIDLDRFNLNTHYQSVTMTFKTN